MTKIKKKDAGFTLPEMLVALALLALIAVFGLTALENAARAKRVTEQIEAGAEIESVRRHLQQTLEAARPVFVQSQPGQPAKLAFSGKPGGVSLVVPSDPRLERGGLYLIRYWRDDDISNADAGKLMTSRVLYRPVKQRDDRSDPNDLELLEGVQALELSYYGPAEQGTRGRWHNVWPREDALPLQIRMRLRVGQSWFEANATLPVAF